jgi:hypothetical protein
MNDPVLNRKMFRATALRTRAIRPQRYNVGAGIMGVEGTPFFTNESQGMGPNETRTFTKGSKVYTVNSAGQVIKVDTLPIKYQAPKKENIFFRAAERLLDPVGYEKNKADIKRFGKYMASPDPYLKAGKLGAGIGTIYAAESLAEQVLPETAANYVGKGIIGSGIAQLAEGVTKNTPYLGKLVRFVGGPSRLLMNPKVGVPVALTAAGIYGAKKLDEAMSRPKEFTETDGFLGPAGTKTYVESPYAKQKREYEEVMKIQDPREKELTMGNRPDLFSPMSPDDMMMSAPPLAGSELAQTQGGGAGGTTPPGQQPQVTVTPASAEKKESGISKEVPTNITGGVDKKTEELNKSKKKTPAEENKKDLFDRLQAFSQSEAGNMFMLKFAAGLLSGKGGFGEVVGNALNPAVDVYAAYKLKEQEFDNKLLLERYKQMKEGRGTPKTGTLPIATPEGRISYVPAERDDKTGDVTYVQTLPDGTKQIVTADRELRSLYSEKDLKVGSKQLDIIGKLGDNTGATAIITDLLLQGEQTLGAAGAVKLFGARLASVVGAVKDIGKEVSYKDIIDSSTGKVVSGEEAAKMKGLEKEIDESINAMFGQMDKKTQEVLAANGVRAQTLKYFLANAFKSEDRLTNQDLVFIGKITSVLALSKGGSIIKSELKEVQTYLDKKRETFVRQLNNSGYSDLDVATNIFGTTGGVIAGSIYGPQNSAVPDFRNMLPRDINKKLLEQKIEK